MEKGQFCFVSDVVSNSRAVLAKAAKGAKLIFTKAHYIKKVLLEELVSDNLTAEQQ